jgi:hypothetical protein
MCDLVADAGAPVADQRHLPLEHNVRSHSRCQNDDSNADVGGSEESMDEGFFLLFWLSCWMVQAAKATESVIHVLD